MIMNFTQMTVTEVPYIDTRIGFFYDEKDEGQTRDGELVGTMWVRDYHTDQLCMYPVTESDYRLFICGAKSATSFNYLTPYDRQQIDLNYTHYLMYCSDDVVLVPVIKSNGHNIVPTPLQYLGKVMERTTM